ncbi:hypothetical protein [Anaeromicropila populeti]|uniref:Uncharacterized protein n=1 Tax=Anaeromicropila populeti TaxID=37658 RepID=A0A1I6JE91_9FIRM|nr:hypothetical protein [Anaeromicropila populeti]SFR77199.1 hypothetical protein SAMN05661086_01603 [Anaeromicropila populeti]
MTNKLNKKPDPNKIVIVIQQILQERTLAEKIKVTICGASNKTV